MRALLYISESKTPSEQRWFNRDFASIAKVAKPWNSENEVTGFLTYFDGFFLQYLEGNSPAISKLTAKIFNDPRHNHCKILLDRSIDHRSFNNWRARLIGDLKKDEKYSRFIDRFASEFTTDSRADEVTASLFDIPFNTLYMCG